MKMAENIRNLAVGLFCTLCAIIYAATEQCDADGCPDSDKTTISRPNIVILLADDLGYGDLQCYGNPTQAANAIDEMAKEGLRFTQFYSADSMCTPSRAGLLTGRLPIRSGMVGSRRRVLVDYDTGGLPKGEITIPEMLKQFGYRTGMVGKWHLGINEKVKNDSVHMPSKHGFDYVGTNLPMSNLWECDESGFFVEKGVDETKCFLYKGDTLVQQPIHFETLTDKLLDDWREFLSTTLTKQQEDANDVSSSSPFFFYFSFPHVHSAQWAKRRFQGASKRGLYGDNLAEMGWAVGEVLRSLKEKQIEKETLVLFLSDHGPHRELCHYGGSTGGLKGGKSNTFEGGFRIPAVAWMPGTILPGVVSHAALSSLDLWPTFQQFASSSPPLTTTPLLDGVDVGRYLLGRELTEAQSLWDRRPLFFYCSKRLMAVRYRQYKIHFATATRFLDSDHGGGAEDEAREELKCPGGKPLDDWYVSQMCPDGDVTEHRPPLIYDLYLDPYELIDLGAKQYREIIKTVRQLMKEHKESLVEVADQIGNYNAFAIPCCNYPKCKCNYP